MISIEEHVPLKNFSTLGIGGPARYFIRVHTPEEMKEALLFAKNEVLPPFILGKGSNCLFDDRGFSGVVILNKIEGIQDLGNGLFEAGAGHSFSLLGIQTAKKGWSGLEFASGIPATVGGAVFMNAGANGSETQDALLSVDFITMDGELKTFDKSALTFSYRTSPFQQMQGAIVSAKFQLAPSDLARQQQLDILQKRIKTQPYSEKSIGCIFKNPPINSAGKLIDEAGLKGFTVGGVEVSKIHANFLINKNGGTCLDMRGLIDAVQAQVKKSTGILLEMEVKCIPYDGIQS